jgi:hypothetical protein
MPLSLHQSQEPGHSPSVSDRAGIASAAGVGQSRLHLASLSDDERESHIRDCAWLMEDAMRRWHETSDFGYRGEADRWRLLMEEAIRGRSPAQVARMEAERGLSGR